METVLILAAFNGTLGQQPMPRVPPHVRAQVEI